MIGLETLLGAAIGAGLSLAAEVGFGEKARSLKKTLTDTEKARDKAFQQIFSKAEAVVGRDNLADLLGHDPFRQAVVTGLLDPVTGFDPESARDICGENFPLRVRAINRFFYTLETELLQDSVWGPMLERYQKIRFQKEVLDALRQKQIDVSEGDMVSTLSAHLDGSGAIAQGDGAVAVGEGGVYIGGDIRNGFVISVKGDGNVTNIYTGTDPASLRRRYLKNLADQAENLPWASVDPAYADAKQEQVVRLTDIYIPLETTELEGLKTEHEIRDFLARQAREHRISAQEMADRHKRLILLGDPGAGKSTFVNYLIHAMASDAPGDGLAHLEQTGPWRHGRLLPVRAALREFGAWLGGQSNSTPHADRLTNYLLEELTKNGFGEFWPEIHKALQGEGENCLVLLDGLDEVNADIREAVVETINHFSNQFKTARITVTCRIYAYMVDEKEAEKPGLQGFKQAILSPFNREQIKQFVDLWYERHTEKGRFEKDEAERLAGKLKEAVIRPELTGLAERPLLMTVMALLHTFRRELPEDRVELYDWIVDLMLRRWESRVGGDKGLLETIGIPGLKINDLAGGLYDVAFHVHLSQKNNNLTADINEGMLRERMAPYFGESWDKAGKFIQYIRERAGLLIRHKSAAYTFPHRTFQEYLAACHLVGQPDYIEKAGALIGADPAKWRTVFVLAAGYAARHNQLALGLSSVNALCPEDISERADAEALDFRKAIIAGEALIEIGLVGVNRRPEGRTILKRIQYWLLAAMRAATVLKPLECVEAGNILADLGDPRFDPNFYYLPKDDNRGFIDIPAGPFFMGSTREIVDELKAGIPKMLEYYKIEQKEFDDYRRGFEMLFESEFPEHKVTLGAYAISRFPVTVAQFNAFLDDSGYQLDNPDFRQYNRYANHPVVNVLWDDAQAYCQWLTEKTAERGWKIELPIEAQWEKAARGDDRRTYPWGESVDENKMNYEMKIGSTSPVGCFPGGASPYGIEDMAGNVWEWCADWYDENYYAESPTDDPAGPEKGAGRVARGGSWGGCAGDCRSAFRGDWQPGARNDILGFRLSRS